MITLNNYEGKTEAEVFSLCLEDLSVSADEIYTSYEINEGGLFKGKKIELKAISKNQIIDYIKSFLHEISIYMDLDIHSEIKFDKNYIHILLVSDNNAILIGKDGKNLDALQVVIRQFLAPLNAFKLRVLVDASNYKDKKNKNLEFAIKKLCKEVLRTKVDIQLDPMNSYERRIVHSIVSEFENLDSVSRGEGTERHTIIQYKD